VTAAEKSGPVGHRGRILKIIITLLALAGLLWLLDHIGWHVVGRHISYLGWQGVAVLLVLGFMECLFDAAALRAATGEKIGLLKVFSFSQAGAFVNTFIPWEAGEVLKSRLLYNHVSTSAAISGTVVWNYVFKLSKPVAALTAAGTSWIFVESEHRPLALIIIVASLIAFIPYGAWRFVLYLGPASFIIRFATRLRLIGKRDPEALVRSAEEIDATVRNFWDNNRTGYIKVFLYQYLARITAWITLFVALYYIAPGEGFSFVFCGMIYAGFSVMSYLVLLLPTRLGTTEGAGYVLFMLLHLDPALGLITQLVLRLKAIATFVIPSAFVLFDKKTRNRS